MTYKGRGRHLLKHGKISDEARDQLKGRAYQLRLEAWSYRQIAKELDVSVQCVANWVQEVRKDTIFEPAEDVFKNEVERLDLLQREAQDNLSAVKEMLTKEHQEFNTFSLKTLELHQKAQAALLRVLESRRKFMGLDASDKLEVTHKQEMTEDEQNLLKMVKEYKQRNYEQVREMRDDGETEPNGERGSSL